MKNRTWQFTALISLFVIAGCGQKEGYDQTSEYISASEQDYAAAETMASADATGEVSLDAVSVQVSAQAAANRKIIYTTTLGLVVEDYRELERMLPPLVAKHGGFVASSETDRRFNNQQSGTWVVRIPTTEYAAFLTGVGSLGFTESRSENAQDVTEEFVDVEARIKTKRKLEERMVTMLEERPGKLSDVLEIERELARVREEIERMEGRMRFLSDRTSLATVTLRCREQKSYQPAEAPTFVSRIQQSWSSSLRSLQITGQNFLIGFVALVPWVLVLGLPLLLLIWRVIKRRSRSQQTK